MGDRTRIVPIIVTDDQVTDVEVVLLDHSDRAVSRSVSSYEVCVSPDDTLAQDIARLVSWTLGGNAPPSVESAAIRVRKVFELKGG